MRFTPKLDPGALPLSDPAVAARLRASWTCAFRKIVCHRLGYGVHRTMHRRAAVYLVKLKNTPSVSCWAACRDCAERAHHHGDVVAIRKLTPEDHAVAGRATREG